MTDVIPDLRLSNSISLEASAAKRNLLTISLVSIAISSMQLFPSRISALGIEFATTNKIGLAHVLLLICIYSLITFATYAWSDYLQWRSSTHQTRLAYGLRASASGMGRGTNLMHKFASTARFLVDYAAPVGLGLYAIQSLRSALATFSQSQ